MNIKLISSYFQQKYQANFSKSQANIEQYCDTMGTKSCIQSQYFQNIKWPGRISPGADTGRFGKIPTPPRKQSSTSRSEPWTLTSATSPNPPQPRKPWPDKSSSQVGDTDPSRVFGGGRWQRFACRPSIMRRMLSSFFLTRRKGRSSPWPSAGTQGG